MRAIDFHVHLPTPDWLDSSMAGYVEAAEAHFRSPAQRQLRTGSSVSIAEQKPQAGQRAGQFPGKCRHSQPVALCKSKCAADQNGYFIRVSLNWLRPE